MFRRATTLAGSLETQPHKPPRPLAAVPVEAVARVGRVVARRPQRDAGDRQRLGRRLPQPLKVAAEAD